MRHSDSVLTRYNIDCRPLPHQCREGLLFYLITVMKEERATIGGEGNGGIILPSLHYGRDALVGIAIFVTAFADWRAGRSDLEEKTLSAFRKTFPAYFMAKKKLEVSIPKEELAGLFAKIAGSHPDAVADTRDGLKLDFPEYWVHLRASNTEPIIRIYTEAKTAGDADQVADAFMREISSVR
ncbi:MAG TPA: hypothetical protein VN420_02540 [Candidatus Fimivivens sp.]|nr:hypothetical protein [Candidatus Fimivivens sp.]